MAFTGTTALAGLVTTAYDQAVENQNRLMPLLRSLPDKHVVDPTHVGNAYTLFKYSDLATGSRLLSETVDTTPIAVPNVTSQVISVKEFGTTVQKTKLLDLTSLSQVDPIIVDLLARDQAVSLDDEVGTIAYAGTNVLRAGGFGATNLVTAASVMKAADYRNIILHLREAAAIPKRGDLYGVYMHPRQALDLRTETGANAWRDDHKYTSPEMFWTGETGQYEGGFVVESARMKQAADGASSAVVYRSLFFGVQALAEVVWEEPHTVIGEQIDNLRRFRTFSWYGSLNWAIYRQENLYRYESAASVVG
jgi:N4-gp56 family major capsid protein